MTFEDALSSLHWLPLLVVSLVCFMLGALWYSPALFVKAWLEEMKITPEMVAAQRAKGGMGKELIKAWLCTIVTAVSLDLLVTMHRSHSATSGALMGLLVGVGLVGSREATNAIFQKTSLRHLAIVAGHDAVLCVIGGAILGVWR